MADVPIAETRDVQRGHRLRACPPGVIAMLTSSHRSLIAVCVLALTATAAQAQTTAPGGPLTVRPTAADTGAAQRATVQYRKLWTGAKPGARAYDIDAHPSVTAGSSSGGPRSVSRETCPIREAP